jgi:ABC-type multidrug transport system ATPase subunit
MPTIVAQLENVSRLFGRFAALRQVSTIFESGRCYVLLGENGAGKSTLLRVLAGLLEPTLGRVRHFPGEEGAEQQNSEERQRAIRARIGYMSHAPMLYDEFSAIENLRYFAGLYRGRALWTPEEALGAVALDPALLRPVGQYSQGMRQRASLARVLIARPELILLDEPFSNLDSRSASQMLLLLGRLRDEGRCIVLTTHQRELAVPLADKVLTMEAGRLASIAAGPAAEGGVCVAATTSPA